MTHRPNADPVQEHSAGPLYPYIIYRREKDGGYIWGLLGPYLGEGLEIFGSHDKACRMAQQMKHIGEHTDVTDPQHPIHSLERREHSRKRLRHTLVTPIRTVY